MLHTSEKWAAVEYFTSPSQKEVGGRGREMEDGDGGEGCSNDAFPSPQVERITITIKNQKACVSIKRLPITLCVPNAK